MSVSPSVTSAAVRAANADGLDPALLMAVISVETGGTPYESDGTPVFLCEPATFYGRLPASKRAGAIKDGLAAKAWNRDGYRDQGSFAGRRARLNRMIAVDEAAAYESISMGLGQIMGFHAVHCGYPSAYAMWTAFRDKGVDEHLRAILKLLPVIGVLDPLVAHDWPKAALHYNGAGYRKNSYDAKLAKAFAYWTTALATGQVQPPAPTEARLGLGSKGPAVTAIQNALNKAGVPCRVDGEYGPNTMAAVAEFEVKRGLPDTAGIVDQETADAIVNASADPIPHGAREVTTESKLAGTSRIVAAARQIKFGGVAAAATGAVTAAKSAKDGIDGALDQVSGARDTWSKITDLVGRDVFAQAGSWVLHHPLPVAATALLTIGGLIVAVIAHANIIVPRVDSERAGATI